MLRLIRSRPPSRLSRRLMPSKSEWRSVFFGPDAQSEAQPRSTGIDKR